MSRLLHEPRKILLNRYEDERGIFQRMLDLTPNHGESVIRSVMQLNLAKTMRAGTFRGLHLQRGTHAETKAIFCLSGSVIDVAVDLRVGSPRFCVAVTFHLSADEPACVIIPPGFAHGYLTLEDSTSLVYAVDQSYAAEHELVVRWNDPAINLSLPQVPVSVSRKDQDAPNIDTRKDLSGVHF